MRLTTFTTHLDPETSLIGTVEGGYVISLAVAQEIWMSMEMSDRSAVPWHPVDIPNSMKEFLGYGQAGLDFVRRITGVIRSRVTDSIGSGLYPVYMLDEVNLLPPIPDPDKFLCVGKNYRAHLEELMRHDLLKEWPEEPTGFIKLNSSLVGHDAEVVYPAGIECFDYEPEMVFVIGKRALGVKKADAIDHVAGLMLLNDLTAREIQKREVASGTRFWTSKNIPGFGPVGPYMITLDEIEDPYDLWLTCCVNGEERVRVNTGDQIFKIPDIIEHFSRYIPLEVGDMFSTGSPGGVAFGQANAQDLFLKPGDTVDVSFEGLAVLRTKIIAPKDQ